MDDSEKSYGYSDDIYHGKTAEKSYEYGPEGQPGDGELAPEEEAVHILGPRDEEPQPARGKPEYDYGRESPGEVDSFTWKNPEDGGQREERKAGDREPDVKP